jgi:hypothetical protein
VPKNLGPVINTSGSPYNDTPCISADGSILYWWSTVGRLRQAPIIPIVDFNGDGAVDCVDICDLVAHWGTDESLYDIGPMPWGDGVVDVEDLTVLAEYIGPNVVDLTLVAHWPLDEAEGFTAHDEVGGHDATVMGLPTWQPSGGAVNGALELDGVTFIVGDYVLNPKDGPFSVLAWVKGGAPGEAIVSQQGGANWLVADPLDGSLLTDLNEGGRSPVSLGSEAVIVDGGWHRVGFAWDGTNRRLYVDEELAAEDTQTTLGSCVGNVLMGRGASLNAGTSFTGLIDDVRIYNRAVKP